MGYVKVTVPAPNKVKYVHQLGADGKAYAEDVTIESDVPGRLDWMKQQEGKVGVLSFSFSPVSSNVENLKFPGDEEKKEYGVGPTEADKAATDTATPTANLANEEQKET